MNKHEVYVGIDISKAEVDICIIDRNIPQWFTVINDRKKIRSFIKKQLSDKKAVIGMENTGRYTWALISEFENTEHTMFVIPPLHLSKSLGLVRGKNDKIDAERICRFTMKNQNELKLWTPKREVIKELGVLLSERKMLLKIKGQLTRGLKELNLLEDSSTKKNIRATNSSLIKAMDKEIKNTEKTIRQLISKDSVLCDQDRLLRSIPGLGFILSWNIIYRTNEFLSICEARKLACYAGVVPFEYSSGTSVRGRSRVSGYADRQFKSLIHLGAMRAVRLEGELKEYYLRKTQKGKNKMSVLNAVRNKIIHRAFAVIRNNRPYENHLVLS